MRMGEPTRTFFVRRSRLSCGRMTSVVTNQMMEGFGVSQEQLHQDAVENAAVLHPASLRSMQEVMASMMGMEMAAEQMGGDFFVLPSSIHEVLLLPDDGNADFHELEAMVQSINEAEVAPADRLSDNVYHYDKTDRVFELAEKTAGRKLAQEMAKKAEARESADKKPSILSQQGEKKKEAMEHAPKAKAPGRGIPEAVL